MSNAIHGSTLEINNNVIPYVPNSLVYDFGTPEVSVDPQIIGDGAVENIYSENFETAKSKVTVDLKSTSENEARLQSFTDNFDQNLIKIIARDGTARIFENAVVINKPEINTGSDGVISIEFESRQSLKG